jgi:hypothetical protein
VHGAPVADARACADLTYLFEVFRSVIEARDLCR